MENLPFSDEIILKILTYLSGFDIAKCAQASKGLKRICEDKEFQQYHDLKKLFKHSNLKLAGNDYIMVNITHEEAVKNINKALGQNGNKIELILQQTFDRQKYISDFRLFTIEIYRVSTLSSTFAQRVAPTGHEPLLLDSLVQIKL